MALLLLANILKASKQKVVKLVLNKVRSLGTVALAGLLIVIVAGGCSGKAVSGGPIELEMPPEVSVELKTIPSEPVVGEPTKVIVTILDATKPKQGMRIELRENARDTRLYDAVETTIDGKLSYEAEAIFEKSGENLITYHFNTDSYHVMNSFTVEVK